ncbi:ABC transporter substrate-binding protein [Georgenia sp. SYP-B2076]|uniref:ABC transporter substrate-binding protein n=1 Tax=Georgenia sp. SYP-B2076 TaxID=2495881 RepID=UPI000F8E2AED|nr:ABC transporter substrate-binding protein [Georgenia sp. SYP-B2076]
MTRPAQPLLARPRARRAAVATLGTALALSACSVANSGDAATGGAGTGGDSASTVRIVLPQEPPSLEACDSSLTSVGVVLRSNVTQPLAERNATTGELEPLLATEWASTSDTEWTFTLRDDVTFSDGTAFDAEAAKHSIDRIFSPDLTCDVNGGMFAGTTLTTEAVDATTLKVTTDVPDPILPLRLSFVEIVPASASTTEEVRESVGTGPYKIADWQTGISVTLERNEDYWGEAPAYDSAEYVWRDEGTVRAAMVTAGEADLATGLGPDDGAGDTAVSYPNNETTAVRLDASQPPLDDIRVRQAVNYAIDRDGIVGSLFSGLGEPAGQLIPEGIIGFDPAVTAWEYDPEKAKSLIAEARAAGAPVDNEITLIGRNGQFPKIAETVEVLQSQLAEVGLNVSIQMVDTAEALQYQVKPFPEDRGPVALVIQHGNQAGDASFTMAQYMRTDSQESTTGTPELDALINAGNQAEGDARQVAFAEALAYERENITQFADLAHMTGILARGPKLDYEPNSSTGDEMRLAEMRPAS